MSNVHKIGNYVCASIDFLGTKEKIQQEWFLQNVAELLSGLKKMDNPESSAYVRVFSDNFVLAAEVTDSFDHAVSSVIQMSTDMQWKALAMTNCLVRGGITYGQLLVSADVVIGIALSRAYEIETKEAIYPRIVVDEAIIDKLTNSREPDPCFKHIALDHLCRDFDGRQYVKQYDDFTRGDNSHAVNLEHPHHDSYIKKLNKYEAVFNEMVENARKKCDYSVLQKYVWWAKYMNKKFEYHDIPCRLCVPPLYS